MSTKGAERYVELGWSPFPLKRMSKEPNIPRLQPLLTGEERIDPESSRHEWGGIGIVTGRPSGIVVLDVDGEDGEISMRRFSHPPTPTVQTGNGRHMYFRYPEGVLGVPTSVRFAPGLDLKGDGGYVVAPPSRHPNGTKYEWVPFLTPVDLEPAPLPGWLLEEVKKNRAKRAADPTLLSSPISEGGRNEIMTSVAGALRARGVDPESLFIVLKTLNDLKCQPPLPVEEIARIANNIAKYPPNKKRRKENWPLEGESEVTVDITPPQVLRVEPRGYEGVF